ncbi:MAG: inositol monophosphatase family protein [bacterium]
MNAPSPSDLLACAVAAVRAAGVHALQNEHRRGEVAQNLAHDVKLNLDTECQHKAEQVIRRAYPDHAILGEEGGKEGDGSVPLWIIDPIDGTVNFFHGLSYWCSSIAVQIGGVMVAGAVYAPVMNELFTASTEQASQCNGKPVAVSSLKDLSGVLALTGLEKTFDAHHASLEVTRAVSIKVQKIRLCGAAALDLCQVAAGRADAFFESGVYLWDVAAGGLIVECAGGRIEHLKRLGEYRTRYLSTNGHIHEEFKAILLDAAR